MIIMINGSFGIGKTTVANMLMNKMHNAMIYDPEIVGDALQKLTKGVRTPDEITDDFRDIELWPEFVVNMAKALKNKYGKDLIVPMTLEKLEYLQYIRDGFRKIDPSLYHFCLVAPLQTILKRIQSRSEGNGLWEIRKATECVSAFMGKNYEKYIDAESSSPKAIAEFICEYITQ